ncbi:MAG: flavodoxin family protein, partial [Candidatus Aenigmatarchaeota archaeon]
MYGRKILVVFYSMTGSNRKLAMALQKRLRADYDEIVDLKERRGPAKMLSCLFGAAFRRDFKIRPPTEDPSNYELVVLASPIWAKTVPPAVKTYLSENREKIKSLAFVSVSGSGKMNLDALLDIKRIYGKKPAANLLLREK